MKKTLRVICQSALLLSVLAHVACSSIDKNSNTPEGAYGIAEEFEKGERYEEALRRYSDVKNKFPYSNFATKAELAIANVYFKQESYPEAQVAYQSFRDLHPKHPQIDFVLFRVGLSLYNQLPSTIDRDLSLAGETITTFSDLIRTYPQSEFVAEAKEKREATQKMLAAKEEYIADFYFKHENYESALGRYEGLYQKYSGLGFDLKALSRAALSAQQIGDTAKAQKYASVLYKNFGDSKEAAHVRKELK